MRDRTVTVGAPSFEQRMIAWRVGWVVAPGELLNDLSRPRIYNSLVASGFGDWLSSESGCDKRSIVSRRSRTVEKVSDTTGRIAARA